ncbi:hypothetical protein O181_021222 [Austropuccinia psidii MF-1]|uniref:Reverse transcriptase Ty1/copia-type domain-containing protein n=1 Tax=Austropuccinia psidii MF-1 TaxID=1389203 RepID=A0A9Q3CD72_9BASI|nr:hypothetical protein [Austropuccinia psidii MF-1]
MATLKVWDEVELQDNYRLVGTSWVFKIKKNELGEPIKHKAWLWAQGFTQSIGVDLDKTYTPTGFLSSLRTLITFACINNLQFRHIDIKSAFLNAPLKETVYLTIPQVLDLDKKIYFLRLNKAIYGLCQAPLAWYKRLKNWLTLVNFSVCVLDPCVFHRPGKNPICLYIHINDIAIFSNDAASFKRVIQKGFEIMDVGPADLMLGVKINQLQDGISLDQQHFTEALLEQYGMSTTDSQ